ncbi:glycosyltransferase family 2 protein [Flavobacterium sp.]|jgi:glycosyltransferase involved in cell wall biosynthesis|uniref:glycosyltransferase family 2 protein n=1 Tax=Flavobacterium sp. TaxID=239 RepID=UPI0037C15E02
MIKVSVCMITYNHANYIETAIQGVLSQIGNFEIELVIANDNSPDNTDEVINKCIQNNSSKHKIKYIHNTQNIGMMPNFEKALNACDGDFLAICEGDDYWINPNKIEKQVNFLLANKAFSICYHTVAIDNNGSIEVDTITKKTKVDTTIYDLAKNNFIHTCSVLYKNKPQIKLPENFSKVTVGDYYLHMLFAKTGNIHYLDELLAHYRVHNLSYWSSKEQFDREKIWIKFINSIKKEFDSPIQKILNKQIYLTQKHRLNKLERIILKIKLFF